MIEFSRTRPNYVLQTLVLKSHVYVICHFPFRNNYFRHCVQRSKAGEHPAGQDWKYQNHRFWPVQRVCLRWRHDKYFLRYNWVHGSRGNHQTRAQQKCWLVVCRCRNVCRCCSLIELLSDRFYFFKIGMTCSTEVLHLLEETETRPRKPFAGESSNWRGKSLSLHGKWPKSCHQT